MKWWDPHTKKLKHSEFYKYDNHNNKFGKGWSPGPELINGTHIYSLTTRKIDLSDLPFIK